jgi:hypothetical protein
MARPLRGSADADRNNRICAPRKADLARKVPGGSLERRAAGAWPSQQARPAARVAARESLEPVEPEDVREAALDALEALAKPLD